MCRSRNWIFTLNGDDDQAIITQLAKDNNFTHVTFLQLCDNNGLVVMKNRVRHSAIRKMFSVVTVEPVSSPKIIRDSMGEATFSYGSLLNKHQKQIANKSTNYIEAVRNFEKTTLVPEHDPKFETVYNIIASADTIDDGMLKVLENLPWSKHLLVPAVKRYKLKKSQMISNERKEESKSIIWNNWQQLLMKELDGKPDPRKIIWYYDRVGNTGKTFFAKWRYQLDKYTAVVQGGNAKDIYHIISKRKDETKTVIIDMSRSSQYMIDYNLIENVKKGYFQSGKYDSTMVIMSTPHMVIFSNFKPSTNKLSLDRWDVRKLTKNGDRITVCKETITKSSKCCETKGHLNDYIEFDDDEMFGQF